MEEDRLFFAHGRYSEMDLVNDTVNDNLARAVEEAEALPESEHMRFRTDRVQAVYEHTRRLAKDQARTRRDRTKYGSVAA